MWACIGYTRYSCSRQAQPVNVHSPGLGPSALRYTCASLEKTALLRRLDAVHCLLGGDLDAHIVRHLLGLLGEVSLLAPRADPGQAAAAQLGESVEGQSVRLTCFFAASSFFPALVPPSIAPALARPAPAIAL